MILLFKDSQTLKNIDHLTLYDKVSLHYVNSEYIRIMTVLCQSNKRHKTSTVKIAFKKKKKRGELGKAVFCYAINKYTIC